MVDSGGCARGKLAPKRAAQQGNCSHTLFVVVLQAHMLSSLVHVLNYLIKKGLLLIPDVLSNGLNLISLSGLKKMIA